MLEGSEENVTPQPARTVSPNAPVKEAVSRMVTDSADLLVLVADQDGPPNRDRDIARCSPSPSSDSGPVLTRQEMENWALHLGLDFFTTKTQRTQSNGFF